MPKLHYVEKARKAKPEHGIEVGKPYYWWSTRRTVGKSYISTKHYSVTKPAPSQLITSEFGRALAELQERIGKLEADTDLKSNLDDIIGDIRSLSEEQGEKFDNMPEGLQQGDTGQLLEERRDNLSQWADDLENIDVPEELPDEPGEEPERDAYDEGEAGDEAFEAAHDEWEKGRDEREEAEGKLQEALEEAQGADPGL